MDNIRLNRDQLIVSSWQWVNRMHNTEWNFDVKERWFAEYGTRTDNTTMDDDDEDDDFICEPCEDLGENPLPQCNGFCGPACMKRDDDNVTQQITDTSMTSDPYIDMSAENETADLRRAFLITQITTRTYGKQHTLYKDCLLYTSRSPRDLSTSRMPSSA